MKQLINLILFCLLLGQGVAVAQTDSPDIAILFDS